MVARPSNSYSDFARKPPGKSTRPQRSSSEVMKHSSELANCRSQLADALGKAKLEASARSNDSRLSSKGNWSRPTTSSSHCIGENNTKSSEDLQASPTRKAVQSPAGSVTSSRLVRTMSESSGLLRSVHAEFPKRGREPEAKLSPEAVPVVVPALPSPPMFGVEDPSTQVPDELFPMPPSAEQLPEHLCMLSQNGLAIPPQPAEACSELLVPPQPPEGKTRVENDAPTDNFLEEAPSQEADSSSRDSSQKDRSKGRLSRAMTAARRLF